MNKKEQNVRGVACHEIQEYTDTGGTTSREKNRKNNDTRTEKFLNVTKSIHLYIQESQQTTGRIIEEDPHPDM